MRISSIVVLLTALGFSLPAHADWDMISGVSTTAAATEMNEAKYQSPINPAALGGYSVSPVISPVLYPGTGLPLINAASGIAAPTNTFMNAGSGQSALSSGGAGGSSGNTTFRTNGFGVNPTQSFNRTHSQNSGLPTAGTQGLAPVFGYGGSGQSVSPGGYVPPSAYIPGVGTVRIPQQVYLAPGVSIGLPAQGVGNLLNPQLNPTYNPYAPVYDTYGMPINSYVPTDYGY